MKNVTKVIAFVLVAVLCVAMLASCAPASDPDKAVEALKKNGYTAEKMDGTILELATAGLGIKNVTAVVSGMNEDGEVVSIFYFEDSASASDAFEAIEEEMKESDDEDTKIIVKKSGKMIYGGTEAAIKAAR